MSKLSSMTVGTPTNVAPRQVEVMISNLEELSTMLVQKLAMLNDKLNPILGAIPETVRSLDYIGPMDLNSPIANRLAVIVNTLVTCDEEIAAISQRIEV